MIYVPARTAPRGLPRALLAERLPGPDEVVELERSFHVATIDYDKDVITERALAFARQQAR